MHTPFRRFILTTALCAALPLGAHAQSDAGRYKSWSSPDAPGATGATGAPAANQDGQLRDLLKDLNALISEGEKARAADRVFLRDLKDLAARYENPWSMRVLFDDFADGDYVRDPMWSVTSGEYWVERGYGLRSKVVAQAAAQAAPKKVSKEQLAISILGAVLSGAAKNNGGTVTTTQPVAKARPAAIKTRARITNAFAVTMDFSSWNAQGRFNVAVTQGTGEAGYRVAYIPGANGAKAQLELIKTTSRGQSVIDGASVAALEDKRTHTLSWTRRTDGGMDVAIDGKKALSTRDQSFRDTFDSLTLSSDGADVIVKSVGVMGAR